MRIDVDPTDLLPGDVVVSLSDHEESGCHCDVRVCVERNAPEVITGPTGRVLNLPGAWSLSSRCVGVIVLTVPMRLTGLRISAILST